MTTYELNPEIIYVASNEKSLLTFFDDDDRMFEITGLLHDLFKLITNDFSLSETIEIAEQVYTGADKDGLHSRITSYVNSLLEQKIILPVNG